jgi:hypothetical protein
MKDFCDLLYVVYKRSFGEPHFTQFTSTRALRNVFVIHLHRRKLRTVEDI